MYNYCLASNIFNLINHKYSNNIIKKCINICKMVSNNTNRHFIKLDNDYLISSFGLELLINNLFDIDNNYLSYDNSVYQGYYNNFTLVDISTFINNITDLEKSIINFINKNNNQNDYYLSLKLKDFYINNYLLFD